MVLLGVRWVTGLVLSGARAGFSRPGTLPAALPMEFLSSKACVYFCVGPGGLGIAQQQRGSHRSPIPSTCTSPDLTTGHW